MAHQQCNVRAAGQAYSHPGTSALLAGLSLFLLLTSAVIPTHATEQPLLGARSKAIIIVDGLRFKDSNGNGRLDPYEDWRLPIKLRVEDLVARMSLEEKAGLMLIDTLNAACAGSVPDNAQAYIASEKMRRFIFRNLINAANATCDGASKAPTLTGTAVSAQQAASFTNAIQAMAEAQPLGIPALFKSNPRNHVETDARFGITSGAGSFTEFPKEPGIGAASLGTGDMSPAKALAAAVAQEWRAIGVRGMYGYQADLATEPRWYRVNETFGEDAYLTADILTTLLQGLQGRQLSPDSAVAMTIKHFPGGGPQQDGLDPHYSFGKMQSYPGANFAYGLIPFKAAIAAGVSSIMPYYGVPENVTYDGVTYAQVGFAFNGQVVDDLLRAKLGFAGNVNSDTGIINDRAWGMEDKSIPQRVAAAVNGGTDTLSGFHTVSAITDLVKNGLVSEARVNLAAQRLLFEQFALGLFENPYVDAARADSLVGSAAHREQGMAVQKQSIVLLKNQITEQGAKLLPLQSGAKLYVMGVDKNEVEKLGYTAVRGDLGSAQARPSAAGFDAAVIRVLVSNVATNGYRTNSPTSGANPSQLNPRTGKTWGAEDSCRLYPEKNPRCVDDVEMVPGMPMGLMFGGALPWEVNNLSFTTMASSASWKLRPSLEEIRAVMDEVGAHKTVLEIAFRNPYVLDEASGLRQAGAIVATFGVRDEALMAVLSGRFKPQGKLPFALANTLQAVIENAPDLPGYPAKDTLYPLGFGLRY